MADVDVVEFDEVFVHVYCKEASIRYDIKDFFEFEVPGARFDERVKEGFWDGKIRLYKTRDSTLYKGLWKQLKNFCDGRGYEISIEESITSTREVSKELLEETISGCSMEKRDYQVDSIIHALTHGRSLSVQSTGSGKSFNMFCIIKYLLDHDDHCSKALLVVPSLNLETQILNDFVSYFGGDSAYTKKLKACQDKNAPEGKIIITTWQGCHKKDKEWFEQFDIIAGDEAHNFKAKSLVTIMEKLKSCRYRFGFTGTLHGIPTHEYVLEGLFGPVFNVINTKELMDKGYLAHLDIKAFILRWPEIHCKPKRVNDRYVYKTYDEEIDFLISNEARNRVIRNLAITRKGSTLVLFQFVERHGEILYRMISEATDKQVFMIHGGISGDERERVREIAEREDVIIVASYGTFSTGVNIRNLHNVIFASPSKSRIRVLQSVGRVLRKTETKDKAILFDIGDNMCYKAHENHTLKHLKGRILLYSEQDFDYKIHNLGMD